MIELDFVSKAMPHDTFQVLRFEGEEEISSLFKFEITLVSRDPEIDYKTIMDATASLSVTTQQRTRHIHGMLAHFTQQEEWHSGLYIYKAVLVPRLWMMSRSQQNQISQKKTIIEIIENELGESDNKGNHPLVKLGLQFDDYEISAKNRSYPSREYVVQYKETDLNFISRLMEHEGIYYFFEHDEEREKLIITDSHSLLGNDDEDQYVAYQPGEKITRYDSSVIYKLESEFQHVTSKILVKDYNYRTPHLDIQGEGLPEVDGIGFVSEYGSHAKSPEEADEYALIRTEEALCEKTIYLGESNDAGFACGKEYTLFQHFRYEFNKTCMLTKVRHFASQDIESWGTVGGTQYHNEFTSIPADVQYRPKRKTPKPVMHGIMNGKIDSEMGDINRADIDEEGRYKVSMPFDISDAARGKASRRIRMAQPYGGQGAGMSFPLAPGTEVIWTCIDGDIDRPIITGTVPNPLNPSVTNATNNTSNVIKTSSGMLMGFNDGSGGGAITDSNDIAGAQQYQKVSSSSSRGELFGGGIQNKKIEAVSMVDVEKLSAGSCSDVASQNLGDLARQQQATSFVLGSDWQHGEDIREPDTNFQVYVPHGPYQSYLRMGANCGDETITRDDGTELKLSKSGGIVTYTDGNQDSIVGVDRYDYTTKGHTSVVNNTYSYTKAAWSIGYKMGDSFSSSVGAAASSSVAAKCDTSFGVSSTFKAGVDFTFSMGRSYDFSKGSNISTSQEQIIEVDKSISLKVDPDDGTIFERLVEDILPVTSGALAALSAAASVGISEAAAEANPRTDINSFAEAHAKGVIATGAGLAAFALAYEWERKKTPDKPASSFNMDKELVELQVNGGNNKNSGEIRLEARNKFKDEKPAQIVLEKKKNVSTIQLRALGKKSCELMLQGNDSWASATLLCNKNEVLIDDKAIALDAAESFIFKIKGKTVLSIDSNGVHLAKNLKMDGALDAGGNVTAGGNINGQAVVSASGKMGGSPPAAKAPKMPAEGNTKKLIAFWEKQNKDNKP